MYLQGLFSTSDLPLTEPGKALLPLLGEHFLPLAGSSRRLVGLPGSSKSLLGPGSLQTQGCAAGRAGEKRGVTFEHEGRSRGTGKRAKVTNN